MEINGTIYKILQNQEVTFADGTKKVKGGFVIMREGDYPKPVAFELFGEERLSMLNGLNPGMLVRVTFYAESREGKDGKYYTTLRCTNIMHMVAASNVPLTTVGTTPVSTPQSFSWSPNNSNPQTNDSEISTEEKDLLQGNEDVPY